MCLKMVIRFDVELPATTFFEKKKKMKKKNPTTGKFSKSKKKTKEKKSSSICVYFRRSLALMKCKIHKKINSRSISSVYNRILLNTNKKKLTRFGPGAPFNCDFLIIRIVYSATRSSVPCFFAR